MPEERDDQPEQEEDGGARAIWSGTISFGLLSLPVDLFPANRRQTVSLRMLDEQGRPLRRKYYCPLHDDEPVPNEELVRGYAIEPDQYVVLTDEELASAAPEKSREIDLRRFVDIDEIDPIYFKRAYFLTPGEGAARAYRLLARTMEDSGRAGIATFVMRGKEYLVALLAERGILRAETLRFEDELRSPGSIGLPALEAPDEKRVAALRKAIANLATKRLPREWLSDRQTERLRELIETKHEEGRDVVHVELAEEESAAEVIDLMQVLKERLRPKGAADERRAPRRAPATGDLEERSKDQLYEQAKELAIPGRSKMSKEALIEAIRSASR